MTVYVDNARIPAKVGRWDARWSHMTADTKDELHEFAERIGLKRSYFQDKPYGHWHYDVTEGKRQQALKAGAVAIGTSLEDFKNVWHSQGREGR